MEDIENLKISYHWGEGYRKFHENPETLCSKIKKHGHFSKILLLLFIIKNLFIHSDLYQSIEKRLKIMLNVAFQKAVLIYYIYKNY